MTKLCATTNCRCTVAGFSTLCSTHKQAQRRHGDPLQAGILVHHLRPYLALVAARQAKNKDGEAWSLLRDQWRAVLVGAQDTVDIANSGKTHVRSQLEAARQLLHLAAHVSPDKVIHTVLALYLLKDDQPHRFTDRGFGFQLSRRVRGLTSTNAGTYWSAKRQRVSKVYRDVPPRVAEVVAATLQDAFGVAGLMLARREREDREKALQAPRRLAKAMEALA